MDDFREYLLIDISRLEEDGPMPAPEEVRVMDAGEAFGLNIQLAEDGSPLRWRLDPEGP